MAKASKKKSEFVPLPRDLDVLHAVFRYRLLTIEEIRAWVNPAWNIGNLRNRLRTLRENKFLQIPTALQKGRTWVDGGGAFPNVYALGPKGAEALAGHPYYIARKRTNWTTLNRNMKAASAPHILMTARFMASLKAASDDAGYTLYDQHAIIRTATDSHINYVKSLPPQRSKMRGWYVPGPEMRLEPDHMFLLETPTGEKIFGLVEVDRGTESLRHLASKFERYQKTYNSKLLSRAFGAGEDKFLVLFITEHRLRMENLIKENKKVLNYGDGWNRLWFACEDEFAGDMFDTVWVLGGSSSSPVQTFGSLLERK